MFYSKLLSNSILRYTCKLIQRRVTCRKYAGSAVAAVVAHCSYTNENQDKHLIQFRNKELTHEQLIRQACSVSVNAASQLLTQTVIAIVESAVQYRTSLNELISLLEESGVMPHSEIFQAEITDNIVECRHKVSQEKHDFNELIGLMEYVEKVIIATTEASYVAGAESACEMLSERLYSAQTLLQNEKKNIKILEDEILKLQHEVILKTKPINDIKPEE